MEGGNLNEDLKVYELDTNELMTGVESRLTDLGYDVRAQTPVAVWWFKTDKDLEAAITEVAEVFRELVVECLRSIPQ